MPLPSLFSSNKHLSTTPEITTRSSSLFNTKAWLASRSAKPNGAVQPIAQVSHPEKRAAPSSTQSNVETAPSQNTHRPDQKSVTERAEEDKKRLLAAQAGTWIFGV